jgi:hypothetical protein
LSQAQGGTIAELQLRCRFLSFVGWCKNRKFSRHRRLLLNFKELPVFFYFILVIKPQKTCGPQFAQQICQFVTGSKRCGKEVKRKKRRKRSGQLNRGQSKTVSKALSSKN